MKSLEMDLRWLTRPGARAALLLCAFICFVPAALAASDGIISGCAYVDVNQSCARDEGEQLMTGVPVTLEVLDGAGWTEAARAETDAYGRYAFSGLAAGEYRVVCTLGVQELYAASVGASTEAPNGDPCGRVVSLKDGQAVSGEDIGLREPARLVVTAFNDSNADGRRGEHERAVTGVAVSLMDGDTETASAATDAEGRAVLNVKPGRYSLRITPPAGYGLSDGVGQSGAANIEATLAPGEEHVEAVAVKPVGSLGGKVFEDMNNNGVMDADDPGAEGVTVLIEGKRTGVRREFTTNDTGEYLFDCLPDDTYVISASLPDGMLYARYSKTGGDLRSIFTGSNVTREFPVKNAERVSNKNIGVVQKGVISGFAFLDANYNGRYDEGEPGYPGVTVEVLKANTGDSFGKTVTAEDGGYRLENLRGGDYRLRAVLPDDGSIFSITAQGDAGAVNLFEQRSTRRENSIQPVSITSGGEASVLIGVARGATVSGVVFEDADYNGVLDAKDKLLSGIKVYAADASGQIAASAVTNAKGAYSLTGIMPGSYTIQVQRKSGYGFTRLRPAEKGGSYVTALAGDLGVTEAMEISMGQSVTGVNAGMLPASTVSGVFFHDTNDDGLRDEGELGMIGARVRLVSQDGEIDLTRAVSDDGGYFFDGVMPGQYTIHYLLKEHFEMSRVAENGNAVPHEGLDTEYGPFQVAMGEDCVLPLAGAVTLGNFSGSVFNDVNANGVWDEGEKALPGARLSLSPDRAEAGAGEAVSGADGSFRIEGLRPAGYTLTVSLPDGYIFSRALSGLALAAVREQTLACPWQSLTDREDKLIGAVKPGSIEGVIWLDENKDASQGAGELLMEDVSLELVDETGGTVVKRTTSSADGFRFDNVRPGVYTVRLTLPQQSSPAGDSASTFTASGARMVQTGVQVSQGEAVSGLSTGLVSTTSIGGMACLDENGARTPLYGVTVMLFEGGQTEPLKTVVTDESGRYRFDGLWPADYYLQASLPSGTVFVRPDDPNYPGGASAITTAGEGSGTGELFYLHMAQHELDMDIIYIKPARVGDLAWLDQNANGLIDADEPRIPGVTVRLTQNGETAYETVTDAYGYYLFTGVYPGEYTLEAQAYPELTPTVPVPSLRIISSCLVSGDGVNARSAPFSLESGSLNVDFDLGYVLLEGREMPGAISAPPTRNWTIPNTKD